MSEIFPPEVPVVLTFAFVDFNGDPVVPVALAVSVRDADGLAIYSTALSAPGVDDTEVDVIIPGSANVLGAEPMTSRTVELQMTIAGGGVIPIRETYLIRGEGALDVPSTSFMTYGRAVVAAASVPSILSWNLASETDRISALLLAYTRLTRYTYNVWRAQDFDAQNTIQSYETVIAPRMWTIMTLAEFESLAPHFKVALRAAQVCEANEILSGDVIGGRRRAGVLSETIGESSMMFRSGKPVERNVARNSYAYIESFIAPRSVKIARA